MSDAEEAQLLSACVVTSSGREITAPQLRALLATLTTHDGNAAVCLPACRALEHAAAASPACVRFLREADAASALARTVLAHREVLALLAAAGGAIAALGEP